MAPGCSLSTWNGTATENVPRHPVPQVALVNVAAIWLPDASRMRRLTTASNTFAVPDTVTGLDTLWPMAGLSTTMAGRNPSYPALVCGPFRGTALPADWNATLCAVENCVMVYTTCARRNALVGPEAKKSGLRLTVATPPEIVRPRSLVPDEMAGVTQ